MAENGIVSLCAPLNHKWFIEKLGAIEYALASGRLDLREYERGFVKDMRDKFDRRMDDTDMGVTPWSPTRKQWNLLGQIHAEIDK